MSGYFNLELNPDVMPTGLRHKLNERYKGSQKFEISAPDAAGTLIVWARTRDEAQDHLVNAMFDLIFAAGRNGASVSNPKCPFCGAHTQRGGRNSSGTRVWSCQGVECRRKFVLNRAWRGGVNHPSQSKKPEFVRLLLSGITVRDAADQLKLSVSTAGNWAEKVAANHPEVIAELKCACGKPIRHRGTCSYRIAARQRTANLIKGNA
jgi:transposase-like protein